MGEADQCDEPARLARDLVQRFLRRADEARPQEQVLRWVARDGELWKQDEIGLRAPRLGEGEQDPLAVAVEVADGGVDLRERQSHRF